MIIKGLRNVNYLSFYFADKYVAYLLCHSVKFLPKKVFKHQCENSFLILCRMDTLCKMNVFISFVFFILSGFYEAKKTTKRKEKCRKYRHCRICQCLPLSGAAKKEYKINIAIE